MLVTILSRLNIQRFSGHKIWLFHGISWNRSSNLRNARSQRHRRDHQRVTKLVAGYQPNSEVVDWIFAEQMRLSNGDEWRTPKSDPTHITHKPQDTLQLWGFVFKLWTMYVGEIAPEAKSQKLLLWYLAKSIQPNGSIVACRD